MSLYVDLPKVPQQRSPEGHVRTAPRPGWERVYAARLIALDAVAITLADLAALLVRFGGGQWAAIRVGTVIGALFLPVVWVGAMAAVRAYDARLAGVGSEEFQRVFRAAVAVIALVATVSYMLKLEVARGFVGVALPLGTLLTLVGRGIARRVLHRARARGGLAHTTLVVGSRTGAGELVAQLRRHPEAGYDVVAACVPGEVSGSLDSTGAAVPIVGGAVDVAEAARSLAVDTVAITTSARLSPAALQRLAWDLESHGVDVLVAPALSGVAAPRIHIRPVAGLPLLHIAQPEFTGVRRVAKSAFDRVVAGVALLLLAPALAAIAVSVRVTSSGPALFRQWRVGRDGQTFPCWKFRSMVCDAEARRPELATANEADGVLFKLRSDPRVTPLGKWLRRWSLDELPQLWNVVRGDMSLVGPRPPLPDEVSQYDSGAGRRLLVKPGLTGLWQVSGRSDLSWDDAVRLDLYYVENWSVGMDVAILWKTLTAVVKGNGAY